MVLPVRSRILWMVAEPDQCVFFRDVQKQKALVKNESLQTLLSGEHLASSPSPFLRKTQETLDSENRSMQNKSGSHGTEAYL